MAVDFTPTMQEYSGQGKFRYWVQMVLPTIYDDSLSYMELLNKVVYVINLAIDDVNAVEDNVAALLAAFEELQKYTNDYFDNLDVQEEINKKLDEMVQDGTFTNILQPLISSYQTQLDILESRVNTLTENITPGSTTGDAELIDIRTTFNGKTLNNSGNSVRYQTSLNNNLLRSISQDYNLNIFDINQFEKCGWSVSNGEAYGTGKDLEFFSFDNNGYYFNGEFEAGSRYLIVCDFKWVGEYSGSQAVCGSFVCEYTDNTTATILSLHNSATDWETRVNLTPNNKTIKKIYMSFNSNTASEWHIRNISVVNVKNLRSYTFKTYPWVNNVNSAKDLVLNEKVDIIKNCIESRDGYIINLDDFEFGNIAITTSGWVYADSISRVRTKDGITIPLKTGNKIGLYDYTNARFYVGYRDINGNYYEQGWLTSEFITPIDGEYVILLCNTQDTPQNNLYDLVNLLYIITNNDTSDLNIFNANWYNNGKIRLQAHKGLYSSNVDSDVIQNSVKAFENAGKKGIFICETDIRQTSDGYLVCIHDANVDNLTDGNGSVSSMTLTQLRSLKLLRLNGTVSNEQIPTIDEYLIACKKYNMVAGIELKENVNLTGYLDNVLQKLNEYGMINQTILISSYYFIRIIRQKTSIPCLLICNDSLWNVTYTAIQHYKNVGVTYDRTGTITQEKIKICNALNVPFDVFQLNDVSSINNMFDMGVDIVTTDYVEPTQLLE